MQFPMSARPELSFSKTKKPSLAVQLEEKQETFKTVSCPTLFFFLLPLRVVGVYLQAHAGESTSCKTFRVIFYLQHTQEPTLEHGSYLGKPTAGANLYVMSSICNNSREATEIRDGNRMGKAEVEIPF